MFILIDRNQWACGQIEFGVVVASGTIGQIRYVPAYVAAPGLFGVRPEHYEVILLNPVPRDAGRYSAIEPAPMRVVQGWSVGDHVRVYTVDFDHQCPPDNLWYNRIVGNYTKKQSVCATSWPMR